MTNRSDLTTIADVDLAAVTGGAGASLLKSAAQRQRAWAKKIMSQPYPSTTFPGLGF